MKFITPVEVSISTNNAWTDVDCSAYIPSGATGVVLHIVAETGGISPDIGFRKKGSTDDTYMRRGMNDGTHQWGAIGVDSNRKFQMYTDDYPNVSVYLVGYFESEAVFFTNAVDKTPVTRGAWTDIDISSDTGSDTAVMAILYNYSSDDWGVRKNGSTDNRVWSAQGGFAFVGVDNSEIFEAWIAASYPKLYLLGYMKSGVTMNTNATEVSLSTTGAWTDLPSLGSGIGGAIIEVFEPSYWGGQYGLRKNGSSEDIYTGGGDHYFAFVEASGDVIEGKIEDTATNFYLMGTVPAPSTNTSSERSAKLVGIEGANSERWATITAAGIYSDRAAKIRGSENTSNERSAKIIGTNRGNWGIKIAKQGRGNVQDITDIKDLIFTSARGVLGLREIKDYSATTDANGEINTTFFHRADYVPIVMVEVTAYDGSKVLVLPTEWHSYYVSGTYGDIEVTEMFDFTFTQDTFSMKVTAWESDNIQDGYFAYLTSRNYTFRVYYYFNEVSDE